MKHFKFKFFVEKAIHYDPLLTHSYPETPRPAGERLPHSGRQSQMIPPGKLRETAALLFITAKEANQTHSS